MDNSIILLIGHSGSGKTTLAQQIAKNFKFDYFYFDFDKGPQYESIQKNIKANKNIFCLDEEIIKEMIDKYKFLISTGKSIIIDVINEKMANEVLSLLNEKDTKVKKIYMFDRGKNHKNISKHFTKDSYLYNLTDDNDFVEITENDFKHNFSTNIEEVLKWLLL